MQGKTVVVTGAGSGIGRACAELCAAAGAFVWALDLNASATKETADRIVASGGHADFQAVDVGSSLSVEQAFERIPQVDGLVTSAGIAVRNPLGDQDEAGWDRVINVNLKGIYLTSKAALARMSQGGSIVHIASAVALIGHRNRAVYTASKGAILALTRNMALDYAARGIRVNCVCPGFARTGLTKGIFEDPERLERIRSLHPMGRLGEPEEIGKAVRFLLSSDASFITGASLAVDGGLSAGHPADI
ncbi:MAG: SDR family oxidoreductase [Bryobacterales bacterium]|nr:SDR family oxidoreductase [Bryobacterales bacterium]